MKLLVTAGPTREHWDEIRFLSNRSSGRMGYAIAAAARAAGHRVVLVSGPTGLKPPKGVRFVPVVSAREMERAVKREFRSCGAAVMAAAVSDFRPAARVTGKLSKRKNAPRALRLAQNPDILRALGRRKGSRKLIGFALEVQGGLASARRKLAEKNLDYVVWNGPEALEGSKASVVVLGRDGSRRAWRGLSKREIGRRLLGLIDGR